MTKSNPLRTRETLVLLTVLQAAAAACMILTPLVAYDWAVSLTIVQLGRPILPLPSPMPVTLLPGLLCGVPFEILLVLCIRMWQRLKKERTFTRTNARALRRIAQCALLCAIILTVSAFIFRTFLVPYLDLMLIFVFFGVSLFSFALEVMCTKAMVIQAENDMTV